ncbi:MAG TPA: aminotransferase class I/II-fold pyridoxal phosphate-dependent enzyme [Candidatus Latescibacteria bacterium]|nr:aminotransferase class I/II-fold pyridoxal phosphate-dependent enzyme [Candidatus Latescibacterota bacterium]
MLRPLRGTLRGIEVLRPHTVFVVDEAFSDFSDVPASVLGNVLELENLVVLRSFTKLFSVPGLRLGYALEITGWERKPSWSKERARTSGRA